MNDIPQKINKGGVYVLDNAVSPRVVVRWGEENKIKVKNFCINGKRNREQALEEANKFYEENIKPKHEVWKEYNDERIKQNKQQYKNEWNKEWMKKKWVCECGYETTRGYKKRHIESVYHELRMKGINPSNDDLNTEKIKCECGSTIRRNGKEIHETTAKHAKYIQTKNN